MDEAFQIIFDVLDSYLSEPTGHRDNPTVAGKASHKKLADSLEKSAQLIETISRQKGNIPRQTLGQLHSTERLLRNLGSPYSESYGYGYDEDLVIQHLAYALSNAVAWSRE